MFVMLSDIHFDPYSDPTIMRELGASPKAPCLAPVSPEFSKYGRDTNYPLLKSALDNLAATAKRNHLRYDYAIVTGDLLAHSFNDRYRQCVEDGDDAYRKFATSTIRFVDRMIAQALPAVPVFAAIGNNDSDQGDYQQPTAAFLQDVGQDWSEGWGNMALPLRNAAMESFQKSGYYAVPDPSVPAHEFVIVNSNPWAARNAQACSDTNPDPAAQFQWLREVLTRIKHARGTATLMMHILPGIDAMKSSTGPPKSLWTEQCTEKFVAMVSEFPGVIMQIYAGHIHRDDFRLFPDNAGKPSIPIHVLPSISPVYLNNPAVEIGWYDKSNGDLRDYATLQIDVGDSKPAWSVEYIFSRAYGFPRPNLEALKEVSAAIHSADPKTGVGRKYATYYGAGISMFISPENWANYACAQTEFAPARFALCKHPPEHAAP